jgi:rhodanese-related sulfurtransferase
MPLPTTPFTIHGGCNCKAIKYTINVPEFSARLPNPYRTPGVKLDEDHRIPMVAVDHSNDSRRATGAILPMWIVTEISMVSASCASRSNLDIRADFTADELFDFETVSGRDVFLTVYKSSLQRSRWFCSRCGTSLAYSVDPEAIQVEWGWPKMLDILLGTVDREDLDDGAKLAPERQLWCDMGVGWIRWFARNGIPEHPTTKIDQVIDQSRGIDQILDEARSHIKRVTPQETLAEVENQTSSSPVVLVDIRPAAQREEMGSIDGAMVVERNVLEWRFDPRSNTRLPVANSFDLRVIVFCQESYTSSLAAKALQELGLRNATDMAGGYRAWKEAGLPDSIKPMREAYVREEDRV